MNATQQHMIDAYRAARRGEPLPPRPGVNDVKVIRGTGILHRFRATAPRFRARAADGGRRAAR